MNTTSQPEGRLLLLAPQIAALVFHAIVFGRWQLVLPVIVVLLATGISKRFMKLTIPKLIAAGVFGLLGGIAILGEVVLSNPVVTPVLMGGLTGVLIGTMVITSMAGNWVPAWTSAWILVALSGRVELSVSLIVVLMIFFTAMLAIAARSAGLFVKGAGDALPFLTFLGLATLTTAAVFAIGQRVEGTFRQSLQSWFIGQATLVTSGLGENLLVGPQSSLALSQTPVLELSAPVRRLRAQVMDRFDGYRWSTSESFRQVIGDIASTRIAGETPRALEVVALKELGRTLPSPAGTWEVNGASNSRVEGGWILRGKFVQPVLEMAGDPQERLAEEPPPGEDLLDVPDGLREDLGQFAKDLTNSARTNLEKAEAVERFFRENFSYTLATRLTGRDHPLVVLVKERRPAYCVYFASAMTLMLRIEGVPARVVSGFVPDDPNPINGRVVVRQRDAHAWVEVWSPEDRRYIPFDPTPEGSREAILGTASKPGWLVSIGEAIGSFGRRLWLEFWNDVGGSMVAVMKSPITWVALTAIAVLAILRRRWIGEGVVKDGSELEGSVPALKIAYQSYLKSIRRAGVAPRPSETDEELIGRLAGTGRTELAASATRFIAAYRRSRYGGEPADQSLEKLARLDG
jgi:transglutaminase-like putative cysteine protease